MNKSKHQAFINKAEEKAFSKEHRKRIQFNMNKYHKKVKLGKLQYQDLEAARAEAKSIKAYTMQHLAELLESFEEKFSARGGKVIWAENTAEALSALDSIIDKAKAKTVVKSKSMITEEVGLNSYLENKGIEVQETDLGEYIVQIKGETPYHIVTPAMHLSKNDIAELFHEQFDTPLDASAEELTAFARKTLRQKFLEADIGITGGNFLVADTGSLVLVENEGNARLSTSLPSIHVAIVGIEKMIPQLEQLDLFLPLLATYGTGQRMTVYNTILSGPRQANEKDGPDEMYVILLDNGRSDVINDPNLVESMYCIRCGSCLNNCPVYQNIGGHTYESPYSGPIGAVISPHLGIGEFDDYAHLSQASSLCGSCSDNCPVNIPIHQLLLRNRFYEEADNLRPASEKLVWRAWKKSMLHRSSMNAPAFTKNIFASLFLSKQWGARRKFPKFPSKTFNQLWKKGKV